MEIIKNFGVDPLLLGAQVVNFLIVFYLLKRLLFKPVLKMLKTRETTIKEGLQKAEDARVLMEKTLAEEKTILKKAQTQAQQLIDDAKNQTSEMIRLAQENSKKQADKIMEQTKEEIAREAKITQEQLISYVGKMAIEVLQKTTKDLFSQKEQAEVLEKAIKRIKEKN